MREGILNKWFGRQNKDVPNTNHEAAPSFRLETSSGKDVEEALSKFPEENIATAEGINTLKEELNEGKHPEMAKEIKEENLWCYGKPETDGDFAPYVRWLSGRFIVGGFWLDFGWLGFGRVVLRVRD